MDDQLNNLRTYIDRFVKLSDNEWNDGLQYVEVLHLQKHDIFVQQGSIARHLAFTNKGYLRVYYQTDHSDITRDISPLHSFVTALPSFVETSPSFEIIEAATDCELLLTSKTNMETLFDKHRAWERFGRLVMQDMFVQAQNRLYAFIAYDAKTRYKMLLQNRPDVLQNVPLQYVASYLGITQPSLSRLRKSVFR